MMKMKKWMMLLSFGVLLLTCRMAAAASPEVLLGVDVTGQKGYEVCDVVLSLNEIDEVNLDKTCVMHHRNDMYAVLPARAELPQGIHHAVALYQEKNKGRRMIFVFKEKDYAGVKAYLDANYQKLENPTAALRSLSNTGEFWMFDAAGKVWNMTLDVDGRQLVLYLSQQEK